MYIYFFKNPESSLLKLQQLIPTVKQFYICQNYSHAGRDSALLLKSTRCAVNGLQPNWDLLPCLSDLTHTNTHPNRGRSDKWCLRTSDTRKSCSRQWFATQKQSFHLPSQLPLLQQQPISNAEGDVRILVMDNWGIACTHRRSSCIILSEMEADSGHPVGQAQIVGCRDSMGPVLLPLAFFRAKFMVPLPLRANLWKKPVLPSSSGVKPKDRHCSIFKGYTLPYPWVSWQVPHATL